MEFPTGNRSDSGGARVIILDTDKFVPGEKIMTALFVKRYISSPIFMKLEPAAPATRPHAECNNF